MVFAALSTAFVFVVERPLWERAILLISAVPIALISNVVRITITGALHGVGMGKAADVFFHDIAGWFMMPLALALLALELWILGRLFVVPPPPAQMPLGPLDANPFGSNGKQKTKKPAANAKSESQQMRQA
jgi:exosortase/archaeosortase family protein